jgi:hypothetical protein
VDSDAPLGVVAAAVIEERKKVEKRIKQATERLTALPGPAAPSPSGAGAGGMRTPADGKKTKRGQEHTGSGSGIAAPPAPAPTGKPSKEAGGVSGTIPVHWSRCGVPTVMPRSESR